MAVILALWLAWLAPMQQTAHCYALPEPFKHWPVYLEVTGRLDTCTHNWYTARQFLDDPRHTPSIWSADFRPGSIVDLADLAADYPGRTWLLFNEPEFAGQANTSPEIAAVHVRYWQEAIGDNGSIACCGNLFYPSLGGIQWIEEYLAAGGPVPDYWHIHIYVANDWEWINVLGNWEMWNATHGNLPTIISEAGSGQELHDWLATWEWPGIEAIYWFGIAEASQVGGACALCDTWQYLPQLMGE